MSGLIYFLRTSCLLQSSSSVMSSMSTPGQIPRGPWPQSLRGSGDLPRHVTERPPRFQSVVPLPGRSPSWFSFKKKSLQPYYYRFLVWQAPNVTQNRPDDHGDKITNPSNGPNMFITFSHVPSSTRDALFNLIHPGRCRASVSWTKKKWVPELDNVRPDETSATSFWHHRHPRTDRRGLFMEFQQIQVKLLAVEFSRKQSNLQEVELFCSWRERFLGRLCWKVLSFLGLLNL